MVKIDLYNGNRRDAIFYGSIIKKGNIMAKNTRPEFDKEIVAIADYVLAKPNFSELSYQTARYDLLDSLGCALLALKYPACTKLLGPIVPGATLANGAKVPGTNYQLDPVQAAFNLGVMIRWLDYNDTWLAAEWGHPSDNFGAILMVADYLSRQGKTVTVKDVLTAAIQAVEIQGVLALENAFNRVGLDHVVYVKLASAILSAKLFGANHEQICNVISQVFVDGQSLRTYRHAPNTGPRKSWAAGDAASRGVRLALITMAGEMGYPSVLSTKTWGLYDIYFDGKPFKFQRGYGCYVMENMLFKISYPAEFHAQTAVECALALHQQVAARLDEVEKIVIRTQEPAMRILDKQGALHNPADRDHCMQYMVAIPLIFGELNADYYEDDAAEDQRIDALREKMVMQEDKQFSTDYLDPEKRSIANAIQVFFNDGSNTEEVIVEYPVGHRRRRAEGIPLLLAKFQQNAATQFTTSRVGELLNLFDDADQLNSMPVQELVDLLVI